MSAESNAAPVVELDLSHAQQWAVHAAVLDYAESARRADTDLPAPTIELRLLEQVEDGEFAFSDYELDRLRERLCQYADSEGTAGFDREAALAVVAKIDAVCPCDRGR